MNDKTFICAKERVFAAICKSLSDFCIRGLCQVRENASLIILIYIQRDAKLHSLFYLETALHVSGGTTTHLQERKQLYLQHLVFLTP